MAKGEVGADPAKQRVQLETAFNRADCARPVRWRRYCSIPGPIRGSATIRLRRSRAGRRLAGCADALCCAAPTKAARRSASRRPAMRLATSRRAASQSGAAITTAAGKLPGDAETYVTAGDAGTVGAAGGEPRPRISAQHPAAGGWRDRVRPAHLRRTLYAGGPGPAPSGEVPFLSAGGLPARDAITSAMVPPPTPPVQTAALPSDNCHGCCAGTVGAAARRDGAGRTSQSDYHDGRRQEGARDIAVAGADPTSSAALCHRGAARAETAAAARHVGCASASACGHE